jgi:dihydroorotate dehydrogenase (NAD+) catalytic subunit
MGVNLMTDLAPRNPRELVLANPVMVASGTFGYGVEYARMMDIQRLGAICSKGTTLRPRKGNAMPRIAETYAGMLNSIGLQNPGIHETIRKYCPIWEPWRTKVLVNICGERIDDYGEMARLLDEAPGVAGIEVNISCPNVDEGGMQFGVDCAMAGEVTAAVRANTTLPVLVKLSPNVTNIVEIAGSVVAAGADAIALINTLVGMKIDVKRRRPVLSMGSGGLSGPAVKPVAVWMTAQVAQAVAVPVVGVGGIGNVEDALEYFMAGATAIQVGTASFVNPNAALDVLDGLQAWMEAEGLSSLDEIIGVALPGPMPLRTAQPAPAVEEELAAMLRAGD